MKKVTSHFIKIFSLVVLVGVLIIGGNAEKAFAVAGVSSKLSYQGRLTDNNGSPYTGTYYVCFSIWDNATVGLGTQLWPAGVPVSNTVTVTNGVFNASVGVSDALTYDFSASDTVYLNVGVSASNVACNNVAMENLTPRQRVDATAYARVSAGVYGAELKTDSVNNRVQVGVGGAGSGSPTILFADSKNTSDTVGGVCGSGAYLNGAIWYNSNIGRMLTCSSNVIQVAGNAISNQFFGVTGPTIAVKTFTFPDASATVLTSANAVTAIQGGTGQSTYAAGDLLYASAVNTLSKLTKGTANQVLSMDGTGTNVTWATPAGGSNALLDGSIHTDTAAGTVARGDIITGQTATPKWTRLAKGTADQVLAMDATGVDVVWKTLTGGGAPGGATTQIQFNNAGAFGGSADFTWDNTTKDLVLGGVDTGITLNGITNEPATPAAGDLHVYSKSISGRMLPKWKGPSGVDTSFQASFGFNRIAMVTPAGAGTTVPQVWGTTVTSVGTVGHPALAATSFLTATRRFTLTSAATAGSLSSHRQGALMAWRGNAAGLGGFFYTIRFSLATLAAGNRAFVGLADVVTAPTNVDPTTSTTPGRMGMAINANTGNWNWVNNVTGTAPTVTALGASFPVNTTDLYELVIFSPPNGTGITYRVTNLSTGAQTADVAVSTNIPATATFLSPLFWMTNNATASAVAIACAGWYLESDQ